MDKITLIYFFCFIIILFIFSKLNISLSIFTGILIGSIAVYYIYFKVDATKKSYQYDKNIDNIFVNLQKYKLKNETAFLNVTNTMKLFFANLTNKSYKFDDLKREKLFILDNLHSIIHKLSDIEEINFLMQNIQKLDGELSKYITNITPADLLKTPANYYNDKYFSFNYY